jgi:hypothetical protein
MPLCASGTSCAVAACTYEHPYAINTTNITSTGATVSWTAVPSAYKYRMQLKNMTTGATTFHIVQAPLASKSVTGLSPDTWYTARVRLQCTANGSVLGPWTGWSSFNTLPDTSCLPPGDLQAVPAVGSTTVTWSPAADALGYQLRYKVSGTTNWSLAIINNGASSSYNLNNLQPGTAYKYQMRTKCSINPTVWSSFTAVQTFNTPLRLAESDATFVRIYPNPANDLVTVESFSLSASEVQFTDLSGRVLMSIKPQSDVTTVALSELPAGFCLVRVVHDNHVVSVTKLAVMH